MAGLRIWLSASRIVVSTTWLLRLILPISIAPCTMAMQKSASVSKDIPWRCRRLVIGTGAGALPVMEGVKREAQRRK